MDDSCDVSHRHDGLEALYREHYEVMLRLAISLTGDRAAAEDACHRVFLRLLTREHPPVALTINYLLIATRNTCLDYLRQTRRFMILENIHPTPQPPDPEDARRVELLLAEWHAALTPPQAKAIALQHDGFSGEEIATGMKCGTGTVRTHLHRARQKLRALVARERERERESRGTGSRESGCSPIMSPSPDSPWYRLPMDPGLRRGDIPMYARDPEVLRVFA